MGGAGNGKYLAIHLPWLEMPNNLEGDRLVSRDPQGCQVAREPGSRSWLDILCGTTHPKTLAINFE